MRRPNQKSLTVHRTTGEEFVRIREEMNVTSDELLKQMIELYKPRAWFFRMLNRVMKWI